MPTLRYALDTNGPKRLLLSWEGQYRDFTIKLDDQVVGQGLGAKELAAGHTLALPDGSTLHLQTAGVPLVNELRVQRNGRPLPGSATDPASRVKAAWQVIFLIAGLNLVLGLIAAVFSVNFLLQLGLGWGSVILGLLYLGLGLLVQRYSLFALLMALVLFGVETVLQLFVPVLTGSGPNVAGLLVRALVLFVLAQGLPALRHLRRAGDHAPAVAAKVP